MSLDFCGKRTYSYLIFIDFRVFNHFTIYGHILFFLFTLPGFSPLMLAPTTYSGHILFFLFTLPISTKRSKFKKQPSSNATRLSPYSL